MIKNGKVGEPAFPFCLYGKEIKVKEKREKSTAVRATAVTVARRRKDGGKRTVLIQAVKQCDKDG